MNWGKGIVIGMLAFVGFIVSLSFCMFKQPADDYDKQYYEKGLTFDKDYQQEVQVVRDRAQPLIKQVNGSIIIQFVKPASGSIKFISNIGKGNDQLFELHTNTDNIATISADKIKSGQWNTVINWLSDNKEYLYKQELYVNRK